MKRLLVIAILVAACGGGQSGDVASPLGLVGPSSGLATDEPLATENLASEAPASEDPASDPPAVPDLGVKVTKQAGAVARGATATVTIKTTAKASCEIDVEYASGPSMASGLGSKSADSTGAATWKWKVGRNTTKGKWPIAITCTHGDRTGSVNTSITVK